MTQQDIDEGKGLAIVSYLAIIGIIIAYFMNSDKKNPFTNSISFTTDNMKSYTIFNVLGKQILHKNTTSNNITILTNHFKNGMYFLRIKTDKGSVFKKLIRE